LDFKKDSAVNRRTFFATLLAPLAVPLVKLLPSQPTYPRNTPEEIERVQRLLTEAIKEWSEHLDGILADWAFYIHPSNPNHPEYPRWKWKKAYREQRIARREGRI
jgi:hypothetical protein